MQAQIDQRKRKNFAQMSYIAAGQVKAGVSVHIRHSQTPSSIQQRFCIRNRTIQGDSQHIAEVYEIRMLDTNITLRISIAQSVKLLQVTQMSEVQFPTAWMLGKEPDREIFAPMPDASV